MLICVSCVKNEEFYLQGLFDNLKDYVDGFVILDDGSTDNTLSIIKGEPKVLSILCNDRREDGQYDEGGNRGKVITEAYRLGATWILCADPDERYETRFLKNIKNIIEENENQGKKVIGLRLRELWKYCYAYRNDGIWNNKIQCRLFQTCENMQIDNRQYHTFWYPLQYTADDIAIIDYNLYHLRMILKADREARRDKYNKLDPTKKFQSIGYDYLAEEEGLTLCALNDDNLYDFKTIPDKLRKSNNTTFHKIYNVARAAIRKLIKR